MKIKDIVAFLKDFPDELDVCFVKYPSHKPIGFWDFHEWYVFKKTYKSGPKDEEFLAILVEDE